MRRHISGGSWCCSSWYKPSGSFEYAQPTATLLLEGACGRRDEAADARSPACADAQRRRRATQQPFELNYVLAPGPDGYWKLDPPHAPAEG